MDEGALEGMYVALIEKRPPGRYRHERECCRFTEGQWLRLAARSRSSQHVVGKNAVQDPRKSIRAAADADEHLMIVEFGDRLLLF